MARDFTFDALLVVVLLFPSNDGSLAVSLLFKTQTYTQITALVSWVCERDRAWSEEGGKSGFPEGCPHKLFRCGAISEDQDQLRDDKDLARPPRLLLQAPLTLFWYSLIF